MCTLQVEVGELELSYKQPQQIGQHQAQKGTAKVAN